jgi:flagellar biosynthesis/type III secretory pathway chaperone
MSESQFIPEATVSQSLPNHEKYHILKNFIQEMTALIRQICKMNQSNGKLGHWKIFSSVSSSYVA